MKSGDFFDIVILSIFGNKYVTIVGLNFNSSKAVWFFFANIQTKEAWLTIIPSNYFTNNGKYPTFVNLVILNPTITVILIEKCFPTITTYLVPYIIEVYDNKKFCYWVSLLLNIHECFAWCMCTCLHEGRNDITITYIQREVILHASLIRPLIDYAWQEVCKVIIRIKD